MKYLCLVYLTDSIFASLSPRDFAALDHDSLNYDEDLKRAGHLVAAEALQPVSKAITVRVREGRVVTTDGPFAETKEFLGGFILIEARDRDEAVRIAAGIPLAKLGGTIEVRPIMQIERKELPAAT